MEHHCTATVAEDTMKRSAILLVVCTAALALAAGEKHMTIEDSLAVRNVGSPQFSPDGSQIAYTVSEWAREQNTRVSHIYLTSTDGRRTVQLTNGEKGESSPQWSPDGKKIAFAANRDKGNQIWIINPDGGEAEKLTEEDSGISSFRWAPDGMKIAFITQDVPKDKEEREKKKKDKFDAAVVDQEPQYSHLWVIHTASKEKKRLTQGGFSVASMEWSHNGQWIAYVSSPAAAQESKYKDISADRNTDIHIIAAEGGTPRQLTVNPGSDASPRWSPGDTEIAYSAAGDAKSWAAKSDILVVAAQGGTPRNLTADFLESVGGAGWAPDGRSLYFSAGIGVYNHIFVVPSGGGPSRQVTSGGRMYGQFDLAADGKKVACVLETSRTPGDVWVRDLTSGQEVQVTFANPQIRDFALAESEVLRWKGPDNYDIEGILVRPLGYQTGRRYPLILQIHGGPYGRFSDNFNSRAQIFAAAGYAVLMPNPRGSTGYGNQFTVANVGDWGGKDYQDYMAGVDAVIAKGIADPDKLVVMGGSYGGFSTFWTITQTNRFKAAIGHAGISDWYSFHGQSDIPGLMEYGFLGYPWTSTEVYRKYSPMTYVDRVTTPLMITHGEEDRRVPIAQAEEYYRALKSRGVEAVFVRYPREGHGIQEPNHQIDLVQRQLEWFKKHLP
jgi:dipeptidyl aminopeptidase/acylaminoacyl peptidase